VVAGREKLLMNHPTSQRLRILVTSLLLGAISLLATAVSVLADGSGGSLPR
jgi:hypothetical protein